MNTDLPLPGTIIRPTPSRKIPITYWQEVDEDQFIFYRGDDGRINEFLVTGVHKPIAPNGMPLVREGGYIYLLETI